MKLLFDENLSFKLCRLLNDLYPGSSHVRPLGLERADDRAIWDHARANGFVLVTLDADFVEIAGLLPDSEWSERREWLFELFPVLAERQTRAPPLYPAASSRC